jgi:hypothetical protein
MAEQSQRLQEQQTSTMHISQDVATMAFHLVRSHVASHPELKAMLDQPGAPFVSVGISSVSARSSPPGSPGPKPSGPRCPRGPQPGSSAGPTMANATTGSTGHVLERGVPYSPMTQTIIPGVSPRHFDLAAVGEILVTDGQASESGHSSDNFSASQRPSSPSELVGNSDHESITERPVIVDDIWGLRQEFRRPRLTPSSPSHRRRRT